MSKTWNELSPNLQSALERFILAADPPVTIEELKALEAAGFAMHDGRWFCTDEGFEVYKQAHHPGTDSDKPRGLHHKYVVVNKETGEEVTEPSFVLKLDDPHAQLAALVFASSVSRENPQLAGQMEKLVNEIRAAQQRGQVHLFTTVFPAEALTPYEDRILQVCVNQIASLIRAQDFSPDSMDAKSRISIQFEKGKNRANKVALHIQLGFHYGTAH
jgi:hypothetical protein